MSVSFSDKYESDILFSPTKINGTFGEVNRTMSDVQRLVPSLITIIIIINKWSRGRAAFRNTYPHEMAFSQALLGETRLSHISLFWRHLANRAWLTFTQGPGIPLPWLAHN